MPDWLPDTLKVLGGFATGWFSHWLRTRSENAKRRTSFVSSIAKLNAQLEIIEDAGFENWFANSKPVVAEQCAEIGGLIRCCRRKAFNAAREEYAKAQKPDIQEWDINSHPEMRLRQMQYTRGRMLVRRLLQAMNDCAT